MGEFRLPHRSDYPAMAGEKWDSCVMCGSKLIRVLVHFDSGSVAPTTGETITGATSTDTFVVEGYTLISGTFAAGDAVGVIEGNTPTGYDENNLEVFTNNENLNGSTSGSNFATVNGIGAVQISGRMIADSDLVTHQGKKYCRPHFLFKFSRDWQDSEKIDSSEGDRG
jgi:hypothetical protein